MSVNSWLCFFWHHLKFVFLDNNNFISLLWLSNLSRNSFMTCLVFHYWNANTFSVSIEKEKKKTHKKEMPISRNSDLNKTNTGIWLMILKKYKYFFVVVTSQRNIYLKITQLPFFSKSLCYFRIKMSQYMEQNNWKLRYQFCL